MCRQDQWTNTGRPQEWELCSRSVGGQPCGLVYVYEHGQPNEVIRPARRIRTASPFDPAVIQYQTPGYCDGGREVVVAKRFRRPSRKVTMDYSLRGLCGWPLVEIFRRPSDRRHGHGKVIEYEYAPVSELEYRGRCLRDDYSDYDRVPPPAPSPCRRAAADIPEVRPRDIEPSPVRYDIPRGVLGSHIPEVRPAPSPRTKPEGVRVVEPSPTIPEVTPEGIGAGRDRSRAVLDPNPGLADAVTEERELRHRVEQQLRDEEFRRRSTDIANDNLRAELEAWQRAQEVHASVRRHSREQEHEGRRASYRPRQAEYADYSGHHDRRRTRSPVPEGRSRSRERVRTLMNRGEEVLEAAHRARFDGRRDISSGRRWR